ncbi:sulfite exporter TauE/SafE family protein [Desulfosarcina sp. OttesenSCG-928-A07]|nr:sulfite exporter TauE/SafE family protein [Desulfosarcina sp. OttesenSCG-928-G17]MDL2330080.1 sulfite exporter TauE/SafE family protein [Desulfosarcina sp. OttesenSCG-928-A07]
MLFPVSGVEVSPFVPPLVAFAVSFFASMGGISGAFLLLPFQMSVLGYTQPSVSATNQVFNIVAIPSGVYRYIKEKRMVWPLSIVVAAGTLPGVFIGAYVRIVWLPDPKLFKLFAACVLLYIGGRLVRDLLKKKPAIQKAGTTPEPRGVASGTGVTGVPRPNFFVKVEEFSFRRIAYTFQETRYVCPTMGIFVLSFVVGIIGGIYGIGGGAIIAPFLIAWFGLPVHTTGGATLMGTFLTSVAGVTFYTMIAPFFPEKAVSPDWMLGLLFGIGGIAGMYLGARCQKFVSATAIKWMLGAVIVGTALKYVVEFFA